MREGGELWERSVPMTLVLRASAPSGAPDVVDLRERIASLMMIPPQPKTGFKPRPTLLHVVGNFHQ